MSESCRHNFIEVAGVTDELKVDLTFACAQEKFLEFQLRALLGDRALADRLLATWYAQFVESERLRKKLGEALQPTQLVEPQQFGEFWKGYCKIHLKVQMAYEECSKALNDHRLRDAYTCLCGFQLAKKRQEEIAGDWLKHFPGGASEPDQAA